MAGDRPNTQGRGRPIRGETQYITITLVIFYLYILTPNYSSYADIHFFSRYGFSYAS